jgi:hypothetical protein
MMLVVSLTEPAFPADYAQSVQIPPAVGYGRVLGIDEAALVSPTSTTIADSVQEGAAYAGSDSAIAATRQSKVQRLDSTSARGRLRIFQLDHAGYLWPTPTNNDPISVLQRFGLRNQDIDGAIEAWRFFNE